MQNCIKCNKVLKENSRKCPRCGQKVRKTKKAYFSPSYYLAGIFLLIAAGFIVISAVLNRFDNFMAAGYFAMNLVLGVFLVKKHKNGATVAKLLLPFNILLYISLDIAWKDYVNLIGDVIYYTPLVMLLYWKHHPIRYQVSVGFIVTFIGFCICTITGVI